jgi:TrmH family RNA methyltransferase
VLAVVHFPERKKADTVETGVTLFLDRINDPGNLGTIIRLADWFGVKHIFCTENSVDVFNNKVIQSSMGSVFRVPVEYVNGHEFLANFIQKHPKTPILAADMEGEKLGSFSFPENALLIMGSESHGIDSAYASKIQQRVTIPGFGDAESLNVAVATSIILWEWRRGSLSLKM